MTTTSESDLIADALSHLPDIAAIRRRIHRHPEQGLHLPETQETIAEELRRLGLEARFGTNLSSVTTVIGADRSGRTIVLRADMDALPLHEDTGLDFTSEIDGSMHACGHDTHVAMLLGAARLLVDRVDELPGPVLLMFQPGEEGYHGARIMIDEGLLDRHGPGGRPVAAYALHVSATLPAGELHTRPGSLMAAADAIRVRVTGRGGHASAPHDALDPVPAAAAMVGALQTALTRRVDAHHPAVLTIARIVAGTTNNVIPESALMEGTLRTLSEPVRSLLHEEIRRVCRHIALAHGCSAAVEIEPGYPVTVNDETAVRRMIGVAGEVLGRRRVVTMPSPIMGAEDFSYVLQKVPGALAFLGACPPQADPATAPPNHSNRVIFDESAMAAGAAVYAALALDALRG
jgi:hippurate hydrolase